MAHPIPFTLAEQRVVAATIQKIHQACDAPTLLVLDPVEARLLRRLLAILSGANPK